MSLRMDEAEAKRVGFPKITIFGSISTKLNERLTKIGVKEEIKNLQG